MFEKLKNLFNSEEEKVSLIKIEPAKVVMELDKNGGASFRVEGRTKEICLLVGDLIASIAEYDEKSAERILAIIKIACELHINSNKTELEDKS